MSWTDERVDLLKKLWQEGLSASQIAGRLGSVTRNAVIGKVHRLGLSGRATTTRLKQSRPRNRVATTKRTVKPQRYNAGPPSPLRALYQPEAEPFVPVPDEFDIPIAERKSLQQLTENDCRWPIGDPQTGDFGFCNRPKVAGLPYCDVHARRAFQPPQARRREGGAQRIPAAANGRLAGVGAGDGHTNADAPAHVHGPGCGHDHGAHEHAAAEPMPAARGKVTA